MSGERCNNCTDTQTHRPVRPHLSPSLFPDNPPTLTFSPSLPPPLPPTLPPPTISPSIRSRAQPRSTATTSASCRELFIRAWRGVSQHSVGGVPGRTVLSRAGCTDSGTGCWSLPLSTVTVVSPDGAYAGTNAAVPLRGMAILSHVHMLHSCLRHVLLCIPYQFQLHVCVGVKSKWRLTVHSNRAKFSCLRTVSRPEHRLELHQRPLASW